MAIRVLIIDDSALMRKLLTEVLEKDREVEVVGTAPDPYVAREKIKALNPDVLTLDVEMPRMDGLAFLERLMSLRPTPVVMISTLTQKGAEASLKALELGAVDIVAKPTEGGSLLDKAEEIISKVKTAARAKVRGLASKGQVKRIMAPHGVKATDKLVAIGASTGGVEALREIILALPAETPPIVVTQHMPPRFTESFANRLNSLSAVHVSEAKDGERALRGHVYIAPGDKHMEVKRSGAIYTIHVYDGPLVSGHKPSVDVLLRSAALAAGIQGIGVILTGMGRDGADGLLKMREAGAQTVGEDESTCVVYGMPKAAFEIGAVERQLPLHRIAEEIMRLSLNAENG